MKILLVVIGLIALGLMVIFNFSATETRLKCGGSISFQDEEMPIELYLKLVEYRWWVGLWNDADGSAILEIPNRSYDYFPRLDEVGDQLQVFNSDKSLVGNLSKLSNVLALQTSAGFFDGKCQPINKTL